jgi:hypothetical protein
MAILKMYSLNLASSEWVHTEQVLRSVNFYSDGIHTVCCSCCGSIVLGIFFFTEKFAEKADGKLGNYE